MEGPSLDNFKQMSNDMLLLFHNLPTDQQLDGLDILQNMVTKVVRKITNGRVSTVRFVPVEQPTVPDTPTSPPVSSSDQPLGAATTNGHQNPVPVNLVTRLEIKQEPMDDLNDAQNNIETQQNSQPETSTSQMNAQHLQMDNQPLVTTAEITNAEETHNLSHDALAMSSSYQIQDNGNHSNTTTTETVTMATQHGDLVVGAPVRRNQETMFVEVMPSGEEGRYVREVLEDNPGLLTEGVVNTQSQQPEAGAGWSKWRNRTPPVHRCPQCPYSCRWPSRLQTHMLTHTLRRSEETRFKCHICKSTFTARGTLKKHMLRHKGILNFKCEVCGKQFVDQGSLNIHSVVHTGAKPYSCEECGKSYNCGSNLARHKRVHTGERPYKCDHCDVAFRDLASLKWHRIKYTGARPFSCPTCQKTFKSSSDLHRHQRTIHSNLRPHKCSQCDMTFKTKDAAKAHMRCHSKTKNFFCDDCGKGFKAKNYLQTHKQTVHSDVKAFQCNQCGKCFSSGTILKAHLITHTNLKPHKCSVCKQAFNQYSNMRRHEKIHTGEKRYKCRYCDKAFKESNSWKYHETTHFAPQWECNDCGAAYRTQNTLQNHVKSGKCPGVRPPPQDQQSAAPSQQAQTKTKSPSKPTSKATPQKPYTSLKNTQPRPAVDSSNKQQKTSDGFAGWKPKVVLTDILKDTVIKTEPVDHDAQPEMIRENVHQSSQVSEAGVRPTGIARGRGRARGGKGFVPRVIGVFSSVNQTATE